LQGALKRDQIRSRRICLEIIEEGHQGPDHPMHPAIPETGYLKTFFARLLPN